MKNADIIIIGAGSAGLTAGMLLAETGKKIIILEAKSAPGGRIHTYGNEQGKLKEAGAEFIHGDLPLTIKLLDKAGIPYEEVKGEMWQFKKGQFKKSENFIEDWPLLMEKLNNLNEDMSMENFLSSYFSGDQYAGLRNSVKSFLEGYDAATLQKASALGLREEWNQENEMKQYRIQGGYGRLIKFLMDSFVGAGGVIEFNQVAKKVDWRKDDVKIYCENGQAYAGRKLIVTASLGMLCAEQDEAGALVFEPMLADKKTAVEKLGFGAVIKFILDFRTSFWHEVKTGDDTKSLQKMGFLFSDAEIPTWWTQYPNYPTLLTGWLAGPKAAAFANHSNDELVAMALKSLSEIFNLSIEKLKEELITGDVFNWTEDPFTKGAYSYASVKHTTAMDVLKIPTENTIYFSGEGLYSGPEIGTVEAALCSGEETAQSIIDEKS